MLRREKSDDVIIVKAAIEQVDLAIEAAERHHPRRQRAGRRRAAGPRSGAAIAHAAASRFWSRSTRWTRSRAETGADEFAQLGFEKIFPVSAIHGEGIENLMDAAFRRCCPQSRAESPKSESRGNADATARKRTRTDPAPTIPSPLKLAIVGRPNVGKSSIINALTKSERVIVSPIPGTTRDAVDVPFEVETDGVRQKYILIDTAGMRKTRRVDDSIEFFSVKRAEESIARCDIAVLVLDAEAGHHRAGQKSRRQHRRGAQGLHRRRQQMGFVRGSRPRGARGGNRAAQPKETARRQRNPMTTLGEFGEWVQEKLFFLDYAPVIFTSAKSGFHLDRLLEAVRYVAAQLQQKIPTAILNRTLQRRRRTPPAGQRVGHRLKFFTPRRCGRRRRRFCCS